MNHYLIGSIASYNWRPTSDVDMTLVVRTSEVEPLKERFRGINGQPLLGTGHPVNFFVTDRFDPGNADSIYDLSSHMWVKGPTDVHVGAADFMGRFRESVSKSDAARAELTRDLIDYDILKAMDGAKRKELDGQLKAKIREIDDDVRVIVDQYKAVKGLRKLAFSEPPADGPTVAGFGSKNKLPANVIYKLYERYRYNQLAVELLKVRPVDSESGVEKVKDIVKG